MLYTYIVTIKTEDGQVGYLRRGMNESFYFTFNFMSAYIFDDLNSSVAKMVLEEHPSIMAAARSWKRACSPNTKATLEIIEVAPVNSMFSTEIQ